MEIREALEKAFDSAAEQPEAEVPAMDAPQVDEAAGESIGESVEASGPMAAMSRGRDEKGRFVPAAKTSVPAAVEKPSGKHAESVAKAPPPSVVAPETQEAAPVTQETVAPVTKAPAAWKPTAREEWSKLPATVQQEVARRETEVARVLQETAEARKGFEQFRSAVQPYEQLLRSEGLEPLQAVQSALQVAAALRGPNKARVIAQLVQQFRVPIEELDASLAGQGSAAQAVPEYRDPRVDQLLGEIEQAKQTQQKQRMQEFQAQVDAARQKYEFFEDLKQDAHDLLYANWNRGGNMTLDEALTRAQLLNPEISAIMQQREAAKRATDPNTAVQRAKAASKTARAQPMAAPSGGTPADLRGQLEAAWEHFSGR